jgi:AcrR family transcriptional regulator
MPARRSRPGTEDLRPLAIRVGRALLEQSGPEDLSLREVAREAGVTAMGLAHHFGDRNGLLEAMAREGWVELSQDLLPIEPGALREALDALVSFSRTRPGLFRLMRSPDMAPHLEGAIAHCLGHWARLTGDTQHNEPGVLVSWSWALGLADVVMAGVAPADCLEPDLVTGLLERMARAMTPSP